MKTIIGFILSGIIISVAAMLLPGVEIASFGRAIGVAIVLAILSSTIGSLLRLIALPLNIITLGLVGGLITIAIVLLTSNLIEGFSVGGFRNAVFFSIIVGILSSFTSSELF